MSATCELSHILTPSIKSSLLLKRCYPNQFFRYVNGVVVALSEIRAVRRMVKQLPLEMLRQYLSASRRQKTDDISFLAANFWLNFFTLFGECLCIHCLDCSLVSTFKNGTQASSPVTRMM
jgi:hypothetical protein